MQQRQAVHFALGIHDQRFGAATTQRILKDKVQGVEVVQLVAGYIAKADFLKVRLDLVDGQFLFQESIKLRGIGFDADIGAVAFVAEDDLVRGGGCEGVAAGTVKQVVAAGLGGAIDEGVPKAVGGGDGEPGGGAGVVGGARGGEVEAEAALDGESIHAETDEGLGTRSDRQEYGGAAREPPGLRVQGRARLCATGSECVKSR